MLEVVNKIIEMSIQASFVICMVLIVRFLFLKLNIPKQLIQILWVIPLFRLVCPVTIATGFSIVPQVERSVDRASNTYDVSVTLPLGGSIETSGAMSTWEKAGNTTATIGQTESVGDAEIDAVSQMVDQGLLANLFETNGVLTPLYIFAAVWLLGIACLALYSIVSTIRLRKKLVGSVCIEKNYYRADHIETPFVMGVIRPKIYLPSSMPETAADMILAHENMHIRRKDHIVKLIVFAIACVYWFNPLTWVMYILFCRDMESAVDEKVVSGYNPEERKTYATLLLALSTGHQHLLLSPLAFGEGDVKKRVKHVVKDKKPITIVVLVAVAAAIILAIGLISSPSNTKDVFKGGKNINNVTYVSFLPALFPEDPEAKDGYKITTDVIAFSDKCFSPQLGERIKADWKTTKEEHYMSGKLIGSCYEYMDTWEECEAFIGYEIENPLKDVDWLVPADAGTGMSLEEEPVYESAYPQKHHGEVHFYGNQKGELEFVNVSAGYLTDDVRITMNALCYGENYEEEFGIGSVYAEDVDFEVRTLDRTNGGSVVVIFEPLDPYYASNIYLAQNNIFYTLRVMGDMEHIDDVRDVTAKLVELFGAEAVDELFGAQAQTLPQRLTDKYVNLAILPILDLDITGEYLFDDRTFIVNNQVDNVLEEMAYEYHLYSMMPDYEKVKLLVAEDTPLYGTIANEEEQFLKGQYFSEEELYAIDVFHKEDLSRISNYAVNDIQSMLIQYQLYEYAIVKVDYHVKYNSALEEAGPQYGPGRHCMYYLIGRKNTRDDWKIYEAYRDEYFVLE